MLIGNYGAMGNEEHKIKKFIKKQLQSGKSAEEYPVFKLIISN